MSNLEVWKIRQKSTGLFSGGGTLDSQSNPSRVWSEKGKIWNRLNHVKNHLNLSAGFYRRYQDDIEVVRLVMVVSEKDTISMREMLSEREERHEQKRVQREQQRREQRLAELEREQARIQSELKELKR